VIEIVPEDGEEVHPFVPVATTEYTPEPVISAVLEPIASSVPVAGAVHV
jgi:hypothetical protein